MFTPLTAAGGKIVTCHGDLHAGNMVAIFGNGTADGGEARIFEGKVTGTSGTTSSAASSRDEVDGNDKNAREDQDDPRSLRFLDLEFTTAAAAWNDLGYVCFHYEDMPREQRTLARDDVRDMRRAFLRSYLEAVKKFDEFHDSMQEPVVTEEDVDKLLIDATLGACAHHFGPLTHFSPLGSDLEALQQFKHDAADLCGSEVEQRKFAAWGPEGWLAEKGYGRKLAAGGWDREDVRYTEFAFIRRILDYQISGKH
ncbi:unnamed protein product [Amoebophrya sp. A120]|nr:unnamed protein product [Amoebophrya sp. A120]|eukprot:GSA120T00000134001.1